MRVPVEEVKRPQLFDSNSAAGQAPKHPPGSAGSVWARIPLDCPECRRPSNGPAKHGPTVLPTLRLFVHSREFLCRNEFLGKAENEGFAQELVFVQSLLRTRWGFCAPPGYGLRRTMPDAGFGPFARPDGL